MIVVGEKINASRPEIKGFIQASNSQGIIELARQQALAGADYIDINVGTGTGSREDEVRTMKWLAREVGNAIDKPLCIDSADPMVLQAGLETVNNEKTLINSVKAEHEALREIVELASNYRCRLVGLAMDESGIPSTVEGRISACRKIANTCTAKGVSLESLFLDPLVLPVSADVTQGLVTLEVIRKIVTEFPAAKTILGLSNISFGLPARSRLNRAFLHMAAFAGLDAIIADPLDEELMAATKTVKVLLGKDRHCRGYTRAFRN
jgi:cobalamin-dependent methionine synthase I